MRLQPTMYTKASSFQREPWWRETRGKLVSFLLTIHPHLWCRALLHSAETYEDPDRFWPERYLDGEGKLNNTVPDAMKVAFGYGTRVCPVMFTTLPL